MKWNKSKTGYVAGLLCAAAIVCLGVPGQLRTTVTIAWDYPINGLSTQMQFKVYASTNILTSVSTWPVVASIWWTNTSGTTVVGTNNHYIYQATFPTLPAQMYFAVTASNWWGESDFSAVAQTPVPPRSDVRLRIGP